MKIREPQIRRVALSLIVVCFALSAPAQNKAAEPEKAPSLASTPAYSARAADPPRIAGAPQDVHPSGSGDDSWSDLWKSYDAAVEHVGIWRNEDVRLLKVPAVAPDGTVEVVTGAKHDLGNPLADDTWVTVVPELQKICRHFTGNVTMQVRQLLGLPPDFEIPLMIVMKVRATDIFRPTPDPTPWTLCPCGNPSSGSCNFNPADQCGNSFPRDVAPSHVQWIANNLLSSRKLPHGFPWTNLGYTYNWKPGADRYGTSEYIVPRGSEVVVVSRASTEDYCKQ